MDGLLLTYLDEKLSMGISFIKGEGTQTKEITYITEPTQCPADINVTTKSSDEIPWEWNT